MKNRCLHVAIAILFVIGYILLTTYTPFGFKCLLYETTGLYCPGCGMTRGCLALLHLQFYQAFRYNCLVIPFTPIILILVFVSVYQYIRYGDLENIIIFKMVSRWYPIIIPIILAFGIIRNFIPMLAPTVIS